MTFGVVVESNKRNQKIWVSSVPLLPGCNAMGSGLQDVLKKTESAIHKYFRRNARTFSAIPTNVKCRMISSDEFDAMIDEPLKPMPVLVGATSAAQSELVPA